MLYWERYSSPYTYIHNYTVVRSLYWQKKMFKNITFSQSEPEPKFLRLKKRTMTPPVTHLPFFYWHFLPCPISSSRGVHALTFSKCSPAFHKRIFYWDIFKLQMCGQIKKTYSLMCFFLTSLQSFSCGLIPCLWK